MKRTAVTLVLLLAGVAGAADYATATKHDELRASSRETSPRKVQWAPTGNFSALHARAVFEEESGEAARPYAREGQRLAAVSFYQRWYDSTTGCFLSRDSVGAGSYFAAPNGLGWARPISPSVERLEEEQGLQQLPPEQSDGPSAFPPRQRQTQRIRDHLAGPYDSYDGHAFRMRCRNAARKSGCAQRREVMRMGSLVGEFESLPGQPETR